MDGWSHGRSLHDEANMKQTWSKLKAHVVCRLNTFASCLLPCVNRALDTKSAISSTIKNSLAFWPIIYKSANLFKNSINSSLPIHAEVCEYTASQKKLCKTVSVRTLSNFQNRWQFFGKKTVKKLKLCEMHSTWTSTDLHNAQTW